MTIQQEGNLPILIRGLLKEAVGRIGADRMRCIVPPKGSGEMWRLTLEDLKT